MEVAARVKERGLDIEAPIIHAWGTDFGRPVVGSDSWTPRPGRFHGGTADGHRADALLGIQLRNLTQVGPDGCVSLHKHGTELARQMISAV